MTDDRLSEVLDLIQVRAVVSGGSAARGRWRIHSAIDEDLKFIAVVVGSARLTADGLDAPIELAEGDVAVLNGRAWLTLEGGSGDGPLTHVDPPAPGTPLRDADLRDPHADVLIGGRVDLDPVGRELLTSVLPPVAHIDRRSPVGADVRAHVQRISRELAADRVGSAFAIRQYGQLLVLDIVRASMLDPDVPAGWLRLLADERLRPALAVIHAQPARAWSLDSLARASAMSRSSFAQRFREVAGTTPLAYLIEWRMLLARRELRSGDRRVGELAFALGYGSESAFSSAFKRHTGEAPVTYRTRIRRPGAEQRVVSAPAGHRPPPA
ncbi:AraC family transcriptional regulator [Clavibacter sepedonicus]|uniref:AraC-family transcriptional regulator n=2 Tax=Clavibacter sepedonicus TaxID=31964 RepID=B0RCB3_CLASE|nr:MULTISPECIES: AraC family transcriptional regulator [Clavibacter]MBD5382940.1 AraC family transcriptional regulator [Clavibacter sp.]OQJ53991.1 AraC family transcriptional regulator [Clavibacter sepedonicus]UUK65520.1 AraC family transcriptional regulator [Clavibacter sepedonicus]CAQ03001.1 putative AraC-family transcriptional regulator [Clavibacter sepedonicus]